MRIRVHAEDDFASDSILVRMIYVGRDNSKTVASRVRDGHIEYAAGVDPGDVVDPLLRLSVDEAHALYDALGVVLNRSHPHADQGRADLLHERERVDKLIGTLSTIASMGPSHG